jgi:hypothetical protein
MLVLGIGATADERNFEIMSVFLCFPRRLRLTNALLSHPFVSWFVLWLRGPLAFWAVVASRGSSWSCLGETNDASNVWSNRIL